MSAAGTFPGEVGPGRLAVVTGAASGIGRELATCLVRDGWAVVLAADADSVHATARVLDAEGPGRACAVRVDLATPDGVGTLHDEVARQTETLGAVVLVPGTPDRDRTDDAGALDGDLRVVDLHVRGVVHVLTVLLPDLLEHGWGRVLVTAPVTPAASSPGRATSDASRAFVQAYAAARRQALLGTGVTVTSVRSGGTPESSAGRTARLARDAYAAMLGGRATVAPGSPLVRLQDAATRLVPDLVRGSVPSRFTAS